jgi:hypothetical protein
MNPGQIINLNLKSGENKQALITNVLLQIHLFTRGNYRYGFVLGKTDENGQLNISYADIENLRHDSSLEFLMDYNTPLIHCDPYVVVIVRSNEDLLTMKRDALENFDQIPDWAISWPSNSNEKTIKVNIDLTKPVLDALILVD